MRWAINFGKYRLLGLKPTPINLIGSKPHTRPD